VASYKAGDKRWEGKTDKDVLELEPGETGMFTISLTTPELRDYWGSDLTVDLESNSGKSKFLNLPKPPIAILGVTIPSYITIEDSLTFTGSQSYWNIIDYQWDFGDDATDSGSTVTHSFTKSGDFDVVLTVTDDNGFTATRIQAVSINNQPPIVMVVASPRNRTVEVDQPIKFDASVTQDRDGEIVSYSWDFGYFGDYFEGVFPVIEHSYDQPDTYYVTLTVTDNLGATVNTTFNVIVKTKSTTHVEEDVIIEEKVVTDPMSYLPVALILIVVLAGIIIIIRKRSFLNHMQDKLDEDEK
jgi:PKD repeat protein